MNEFRTLLENFWICKDTDSEFSEICQGAARLEDCSYGKPAEIGEKTGPCGSLYGNRGIYGDQGLLYFVCSADVFGGQRGTGAVSFVRVD